MLFKSPMHARKASHGNASPRIEVGGRTRLDMNSETRSIYKLDPNFSEPSRTAISAFASEHKGDQSNRIGGAGSPQKLRTLPNQGSDIEKLFQKLGVEDRSQILDKIHKMRMKAFDKRDYENLAKPHRQAYNP